MYTTEQVLAKVTLMCDAIKDSKPYQEMKKAKTEINEHTAAKVMLNDFRTKQMEIYQKNPSEEAMQGHMEEMRKLYEIISYNPYVRAFLAAEMEFGQLMHQLQNLLTETLAPVLDDPEQETDNNQETAKE